MDSLPIPGEAADFDLSLHITRTLRPGDDEQCDYRLCLGDVVLWERDYSVWYLPHDAISGLIREFVKHHAFYDL